MGSTKKTNRFVLAILHTLSNGDHNVFIPMSRIKREVRKKLHSILDFLYLDKKVEDALTQMLNISVVKRKQNKFALTGCYSPELVDSNDSIMDGSLPCKQHLRSHFNCKPAPKLPQIIKIRKPRRSAYVPKKKQKKAKPKASRLPRSCRRPTVPDMYKFPKSKRKKRVTRCPRKRGAPPGPPGQQPGNPLRPDKQIFPAQERKSSRSRLNPNRKGKDSDDSSSGDEFSRTRKRFHTNNKKFKQKGKRIILPRAKQHRCGMSPMALITDHASSRVRARLCSSSIVFLSKAEQCKQTGSIIDLSLSDSIIELVKSTISVGLSVQSFGISKHENINTKTIRSENSKNDIPSYII